MSTTDAEMTLGEAADRLYVLRQERYEVEHELEAMKQKEKELENYLIENLSSADATGVAGNIAKVNIVVSRKPVAEDWCAIHKFVVAHDRFDLLQRRLSEAAVKEIWEAGEAIDGVGVFNVKKVSLTKR